ncbi:MAG TPA: hypothetical protein VLC46_26715 [Thermoanaerobaculia bacterium]|jgi:hypothetical protein|nr:hypothetical protein [Thermoanaerobaculia bacterium]
MSDVMQPVFDARKTLADATQRAVDALLKQRDAIDEKLKDLGHGKRGRPPKEPGK